jgi:hypothetical protein
VPVLFLLICALFVATNLQANDEWKFGIGSGITSFSLDGDIGFPTGTGGVIVPVDLDNSDTSDLVESGFGLGGFAGKGKWMILFSAGTATLEDSDGGSAFEWDRTQTEVAGVYNFARTGKHAWGVLFGARHIAHDWSIVTPTTTASLDESWTDALVGVTHAVPFAGKWSWSHRLDAGLGDSEGSFLFNTKVNRHWKQWTVYLMAKHHAIEFGEASDIDNADFYLYDVDEPGLGLGFLFTWGGGA